MNKFSVTNLLSMAVVNWTIMANENVTPCTIKDHTLLLRMRRDGDVKQGGIIYGPTLSERGIAKNGHCQEVGYQPHDSL
jgi:hypothetical protein